MSDLIFYLLFTAWISLGSYLLFDLIKFWVKRIKGQDHT